MINRIILVQCLTPDFRVGWGVSIVRCREEQTGRGFGAIDALLLCLPTVPYDTGTGLSKESRLSLRPFISMASRIPKPFRKIVSMLGHLARRM